MQHFLETFSNVLIEAANTTLTQPPTLCALLDALRHPLPAPTAGGLAGAELPERAVAGAPGGGLLGQMYRSLLQVLFFDLVRAVVE